MFDKVKIFDIEKKMFEYYYLADVVVKFYNLEKEFKRYLHIQFFFSSNSFNFKLKNGIHIDCK